MATNILGTYDIHSPEFGKALQVDIIEGLDDTHVDHIEQAWAPMFRLQRDKALLHYYTQLPEEEQTSEAFSNILQDFGVPDSHWDWRQKCSIATGTQRQTYGVVNGDQVEAAMMLRFGEKTRLKTLGQPLVYVDFLATAPWNRSTIQQPERFRRLGTMLLGSAVEISKMHGYGGRCGLHSLPSAEGFYRRAGMHDLGVDAAYYNLNYFEFDADTACAFIA